MKLHKLLDLALKDLKKCDEDENFEIDMAVWFNVDAHNKCTVCMAGAVLAQEVHGGDIQNVGKSYTPGSTPIPSKMHAIDDLRELCISSAYTRIYGVHPEGNLMMDIDDIFQKITNNNEPPTYRDDKEHFYKVMEELQSELKKIDI